MASMNKVMLLGHLGRDPELRYATSGNAIANFTIATTRTWKNKDGEKQEETEWHRCVAFGKVADIIGQYVKKGDAFLVTDGYLKTRKWEDKEGVERYTTEIVVNDMQLMGKKGDRDDGATPQQRARQEPVKTAEPKKQDDELDDSIPF